MKPEDYNKGRPNLFGAALLFVVVMGAFLGTAAIFHRDSPLRPEWNPIIPLQFNHGISPLTSWKLDRAVANTESCLAALDGTATYGTRDDYEETAQCNIRGRLDLRAVGQASISTLETRCAVALRLAMWERHSLQPAAQAFLNTWLTKIDHIGSYNCRQIRSSSGASTRWSTHATADAIDISGFRFEDGTRLRLINDWHGDDAKAAFLKHARDTACAWFRVTLSPDYNDLHADHFHLQNTGWGLCR